MACHTYYISRRRHNLKPQMTTTLTLKQDDLLILLNSMEAEFTDYMTEEELAQHDRMYARLSKALQRLEA